jgi:hypothetical protein
MASFTTVQEFLQEVQTLNTFTSFSPAWHKAYRALHNRIPFQAVCFAFRFGFLFWSRLNCCSQQRPWDLTDEERAQEAQAPSSKGIVPLNSFHVPRIRIFHDLSVVESTSTPKSSGSQCKGCSRALPQPIQCYQCAIKHLATNAEDFKAEVRHPRNTDIGIIEIQPVGYDLDRLGPTTVASNLCTAQRPSVSPVSSNSSLDWLL